MIYGSVCSGIETASMAWEPLGWTPAFFSEIEKFPSSVLAHHYGSNMPDQPFTGNGIPNHGDMTKFREWPHHAIELLVGGTPCQSFSVAGLRKGFDDPRGNLMLTYLAIARRYKPTWLVWENVPGVLSSNGGRDFATFIGGLEECGYHASWRVLDAQYVRVDGFPHAVPQRRRRLFVIGHSGDWRAGAAVLFERSGMSGRIAPSRKTQTEIASTLKSRSRSGGWGSDVEMAAGGYLQVANALTGNGVGTCGVDDNQAQAGHLIEAYDRQSNDCEYGHEGTASTIRARDYKDATDLVIEKREVFVCNLGHSKSNGLGISNGNVAGTLEATGSVNQAVAFDEARTIHRTEPNTAQQGWTVRRLTPVECERLMGFPDDYTKIRTNQADSPRYRALGNSMAVNVMRWLGRRIEAVERIQQEIRENRT